MEDRPFNPRQIEWPLSVSTWNWQSRPSPDTQSFAVQLPFAFIGRAF